MGGSGGSLTLIVYPQHHGAAIPHAGDTLHADTAYVKFNTHNAPADGNYDMTVIGSWSTNHVQLSGLKCGDYYILMKGWDRDLNQEVTGGAPFTTSQTTGQVTLDIAVSE